MSACLGACLESAIKGSSKTTEGADDSSNPTDAGKKIGDLLKKKIEEDT